MLKYIKDYAFRQSLSPLAKEACTIVDRIRDEELKTIWTPEYEDTLAQEKGVNVHPGMMFTLAKGRMEQTKLWKIVRKMPKGGLLHAHADAMVDLTFLGEKMLATEGICIYCAEPLSSAKALETAAVRFKYVRPGKGRGFRPRMKDYLLMVL